VEQEVRACGYGVRLDRVLEGGEVLGAGNGLELEVHHLPGHTWGNIALLERRNRILFQGETIIGTGQYSLRGELLTCPQHEDIVSYLETIARVARLGFGTLVPSHLPAMERREAARFLQESLDWVLRFEGEIRERLRASKGLVTALDLWHSLGRLWDIYPHDLALYKLLEAHLKGMVRRGLVEGSPTSGLHWGGDEDDGLTQLADQARLAIQAM
jgi:glyoxylase-like metal-dependent hydrolase (beta-lactamase superfamily II)